MCFIAVVASGFVGELRKLELREAKEIFSALVFMNNLLKFADILQLLSIFTITRYVCLFYEICNVFRIGMYCTVEIMGGLIGSLYCVDCSSTACPNWL